MRTICGFIGSSSCRCNKIYYLCLSHSFSCTCTPGISVDEEIHLNSAASQRRWQPVYLGAVIPEAGGKIPLPLVKYFSAYSGLVDRWTESWKEKRGLTRAVTTLCAAALKSYPTIQCTSGWALLHSHLWPLGQLLRVFTAGQVHVLIWIVGDHHCLIWWHFLS